MHSRKDTIVFCVLAKKQMEFSAILGTRNFFRLNWCIQREDGFLHPYSVILRETRRTVSTSSRFHTIPPHSFAFYLSQLACVVGFNLYTPKTQYLLLNRGKTRIKHRLRVPTPDIMSHPSSVSTLCKCVSIPRWWYFDQKYISGYWYMHSYKSEPRNLPRIEELGNLDQFTDFDLNYYFSFLV